MTRAIQLASSTLTLLVAIAACAGANSEHGGANHDVRDFMRAVAEDVTANGPSAWDHYFAEEPAFFMAVNGELVFPDRASASSAITMLKRTMPHIELQWGDVRIDRLTPRLAVVATPYHELRIGPDGARLDENGYFTAVVELRDEHWRIRNAHWSIPTSASAQ